MSYDVGLGLRKPVGLTVPNFQPIGIQKTHHFSFPKPTYIAPEAPNCQFFKIQKVDLNSVKAKRKENFLEVRNSSSQVDVRIQDAVQKIRLGKGLELLKKDAEKFCQTVPENQKNEYAMGSCCINTIEGTNNRECSCPRFDRLTHSELRADYERAAMNKVLDQIKEQLRYNKTFKIDLTIFAPGFFGSEFYLMTLLLQKINERGYEGSFVLNLIDDRYKDIVNKGSIQFEDNHNQALSAAVVDFLAAMKLQQGNKIRVTARLFKDSTDYEGLCRTKPQYKSDLVIGSDIDGCLNIVQKLYKETIKDDSSLSGRKAVVLYNNGPNPFWGAELNFQSPMAVFSNTSFQVPTPSTCLKDKPVKQGLSSEEKLLLIIGVIALTLFAGWGINKLMKKKRKLAVHA